MLDKARLQESLKKASKPMTVKQHEEHLQIQLAQKQAELEVSKQNLEDAKQERKLLLVKKALADTAKKKANKPASKPQNENVLEVAKAYLSGALLKKLKNNEKLTTEEQKQVALVCKEVGFL